MEGHVQVDGFHIRYLEAGQGRSVVMLHGVGGVRLSKVYVELARNYRVVVLSTSWICATRVSSAVGMVASTRRT
jgi:hypothetical protein